MHAEIHLHSGEVIRIPRMGEGRDIELKIEGPLLVARDKQFGVQQMVALSDVRRAALSPDGTQLCTVPLPNLQTLPWPQIDRRAAA